jgi:hypothetical protein
MSEPIASQPTLSATESNSFALDREKWIAETAFRERETVLKEREQRQLQDEREREFVLKVREQWRLEDELLLKKEEARRSRWSSPLVVAIAGAALAGLVNAGVAWQSASAQRTLENDRAMTAQKAQEANNKSQLALEEFKAESGRLFEAVKINDPDKAANNLQFLLDVGLVTNPDIRSGLADYLKHRKAGEGFVLPTAILPGLFKCLRTVEPNMCLKFYRNPATGLFDLPTGGERVQCTTGCLSLFE